MFKKKGVGILIIGACVLVLAIGLYAFRTLIVIKYWGKKVVATVTEVPAACDRYNHIKVSLGGTIYEVRIDWSACNERLYKPGQQVTLLKHKDHEELIWPDSYPELVVVMVIGMLALGYYTTKQRYKKTPNSKRFN